MRVKKCKFSNKNRAHSILTIAPIVSVVVPMAVLISFFGMSVSNAETLQSVSSSSLAGSLNFDSSIEATTSESSLDNTPRYLWVSDKLSLNHNDSEIGSTSSSFSSGGEYWTKNKWGISGNFSSNDESVLLGAPKNSELLNIDINRQLLRSKNKENYLAVGLGWQSVDVDDSVDADGVRLSLLGKYSLAKRIQFYGTSSWFPEEIGSSDSSLSGYNLEAGLLYKPKSRLSLQAGFRFYDYRNGSSSVENTGSSIFTLGTKLSF